MLDIHYTTIFKKCEAYKKIVQGRRCRNQKAQHRNNSHNFKILLQSYCINLGASEQHCKSADILGIHFSQSKYNFFHVVFDHDRFSSLDIYLTGRIYQQEIYSVVIGTGTDLQCVVVT
jgi:hypothetical protein